MWSADKITKWMDKIEGGITQIALDGTDLVPKWQDYGKLRSLGDALYDLSEGKNELRFDRKGRPNIMYNQWADEKAHLDYLSGGGEYFAIPTYNTSSQHYSLHPAFIISNAAEDGFRIGKYKDVRVNGKNYHNSLFGLPPAYSTGGHTQSHDGISAECDTLNAATDFEEGDEIGNITRAMFYFYSLLSVTEGFHMRGADSYSRAYNATSERGNPGGSYVQYHRFLHVRNGSGPNAWFHDGTRFGIYGLISCTREICRGFQLDAGKLLFIPNNNSMIMTAADVAETSENYKALKISTNGFVARDTAEDVCYYDYTADPGASGSKTFQLTSSLTYQQASGSSAQGDVNFGSLTAAEDITTIPLYLRLLGCFPLLASSPRGHIYMRNTPDLKTVAWCGSGWSHAATGGFGHSVAFSATFSHSGISGSGRVASKLRR